MGCADTVSWGDLGLKLRSELQSGDLGVTRERQQLNPWEKIRPTGQRLDLGAIQARGQSEKKEPPREKGK